MDISSVLKKILLFHVYLGHGFYLFLNRQKYEQSLPDGWFNIIQNLPEKFSIAEQATNLTIIYKIISNTQSKSLAFEMNSQPTKSLPHMIIQNDTHAPENNNNHDGIAQENDLDAANGLAPMKLPWDEPFWRIRVTNVTSTGDVWGRIEEDSEDWVCFYFCTM